MSKIPFRNTGNQVMFPDKGAKSCWYDEMKWDRGNVSKKIPSFKRRMNALRNYL